MGDELAILHHVAARLESAGIPYMVTGSIALSVYAEPRMTRDIDIVVALSENDVDRMVRSAGRDVQHDSHPRHRESRLRRAPGLCLSDCRVRTTWAGESRSEVQLRDVRNLVAMVSGLDWARVVWDSRGESRDHRRRSSRGLDRFYGRDVPPSERPAIVERIRTDR